MFNNLPTITRALLLVNVGVYILQQFVGNLLLALFALWPTGSRLFEPWQLVSYAFLHGNLSHIAFNMLALYMFGGPMERWLGSRRFTAYWFVCVVSAAAAQLLVARVTGVDAPTLGASGGIFGLLLAYAWYFPQQRLILLPIPIPMPAWLFVTLYGLAELIFGVTNTQNNVAHFAHLGGMVGGVVMLLYWRSRHGVPA